MQTSYKTCVEPAFERSFLSTLQNVSTTVKQLADYCKGTAGQGEAEEIAVEQVELCVAEALTNVVKHAYDCQGNKIVNVVCALTRSHIVVDIEDEGKELPHHLLATAGPRELGSDIIELPENGFGWFLIMDQMDAVEYVRQDGINHLRMIKRFS